MRSMGYAHYWCGRLVLFAAQDWFYTHCCGRWVMLIAAEDWFYSLLRKMGHAQCSRRLVVFGHHVQHSVQVGVAFPHGQDVGLHGDQSLHGARLLDEEASRPHADAVLSGGLTTPTHPATCIRTTCMRPRPKASEHDPCLTSGAMGLRRRLCCDLGFRTARSGYGNPGQSQHKNV